MRLIVGRQTLAWLLNATTWKESKVRCGISPVISPWPTVSACGNALRSSSESFPAGARSN